MDSTRKKNKVYSISKILNWVWPQKEFIKNKKILDSWKLCVCGDTS